MIIQIEEAFINSYLVAIVYLVIVCGTSRCEIQLFHELCSGCRPTMTEIAQNLTSSFHFFICLFVKKFEMTLKFRIYLQLVQPTMSCISEDELYDSSIKGPSWNVHENQLPSSRHCRVTNSVLVKYILLLIFFLDRCFINQLYW